MTKGADRMASSGSTVIFLSFRTDRSGQTVQTQFRLIRVYTVCNSLCVFWMHYSKETPSCSTIRVITINFGTFMVTGQTSVCSGSSLFARNVMPGSLVQWVANRICNL